MAYLPLLCHSDEQTFLTSDSEYKKLLFGNRWTRIYPRNTGKTGTVYLKPRSQAWEILAETIKIYQKWIFLR